MGEWIASTLGEGLDAVGSWAAYDDCCKRLLSERAILGWLLKGCLEEFSELDAGDIAVTRIVGEAQPGTVPVLPRRAGTRIHAGTSDTQPGEGTFAYDVLFHAIAPGDGEDVALMVNVEGQRDFYPGYSLVARGVFYCARMLSAQYGETFTGSDYAGMQRVRSIWICLEPPRARRDTIDRYALEGRRAWGRTTAPVTPCDLLGVVVVCLGDAASGRDVPWKDGVPAADMLGLLDTLFSGTMAAGEKRRILEEGYGIAMTPSLAREVDTMSGIGKSIWEKGREEGRVNGVVASVANLMHKMGLTADQALDAVGVPVAERPRYRELLDGAAVPTPR